MSENQQDASAEGFNAPIYSPYLTQQIEAMRKALVEFSDVSRDLPRGVWSLTELPFSFAIEITFRCGWFEDRQRIDLKMVYDGAGVSMVLHSMIGIVKRAQRTFILIGDGVAKYVQVDPSITIGRLIDLVKEDEARGR